MNNITSLKDFKKRDEGEERKWILEVLKEAVILWALAEEKKCEYRKKVVEM